MRFLAVSIGNSTTQLAVYDDVPAEGWPTASHVTQLRTPEILSESRSDELFEQVLAPLLPAAAQPCYVASVQRTAEKRLAAWMARHRGSDPYHRVTHVDLPLRVEVDYPERVGVDRLMTALAVNRLRKADHAAVVVDAGSAVTIDLVDAAGTFQGGVILPGLAMTARALSLDTDALPLVNFPPEAEPPAVVGKSTEAAIRSGLFWGTVGAVRESVRRIREQSSPDAQLFITGGDARRMAPLLNDDARFVDDLVLGGVALAARQLSKPTAPPSP